MWTAEAGIADPYPVYDELRERQPVYFNANLGAYFLTRYADVEQVLTGPEFRTPDGAWADENKPGWRDHPSTRFMHTSLLYQNPPDHSRLRRLLSRGFTTRRIEAQRPTVEENVDRVLGRLADLGAGGAVVDLQDTVSFPLPVSVIGDLVGVPRPDQPQFRWLIDDMSKLFDPVIDGDTLKRADDATVQVRAYFQDLLTFRRGTPADDLVSVLAASDAEDDEAIDLLALVFGAGFETTTGLVGNATRALVTFPDQARLLPELATAVFDEALRWDSAAQMVLRVTGRATRIGDVDVPEGVAVTGFLGAANRDPARFPDPASFDLRRQDARPLSLGGGTHFCLGAALARLQADVLFAQLFTRFPNLTLAGEPVRRKVLAMRGFDSLPVVI
ncbi:cytochrome P450 [Lentzea tibetensis]|uniref:Cytochrome P450 n=1 Tax=Lentzea tibetensis TaxID=2591470 RepID=A0A563ER55_9PSEU|nr:cytochrome P450 [Lentzea tibetensis]TWP50012.1 cytochrome P450 [Lentzea tibetensis]